MPWTKKDVDSHKKGLSDAQKALWVKVANKSLATCLDAGGKEETCEAKAIRSAKSMICVSTFILQKTKIRIAGELLEAANRGIRVYLLTASENQLSKESDEMT